MRAVGYRQVWQYLQGDYPLSELEQKIVIATRQLAKRQMTWLRRWQEPHFLSMESTGLVGAALCEIKNWFGMVLFVSLWQNLANMFQ